LLDDEPGPLYLLSGAGLSTIARALKSIQQTYQPDARPGQTLHIVVQALDNGTPRLTGYQRVIVTVSARP